MNPETKLPPFGKYILVRELGRGGMGIVYEALDGALGRRLAIKTMVSNPLASPEEAKTEGERFMREAQLAARLPKHPHIVGVYEVGVIQGRRYLAMELIEGKPMADWMEDIAVSIRDEVELLRKTALAVHHAHENGIIHRDLKPANILVDAKHEPHITDFGLAKMVGQDISLSLTGAGMIVGTPAYISPEQAQGLKTTDRRTDVYSLGVILFEILTGRHPFQGQTAMEILMKAAKNPVPSASSLMKVRLAPAQAKDLDDICHKALAKKPGDRYRDAAAFAADLQKWLSGEVVKVAVSTTRRTSAPPKPLWLKIARVIVALLALVVVLVLVLSKPSVDPAEAERLRIEQMKLASERRAQEEKFRQERERLAAERLAAEERAKTAERELEAMKTPILRATEVRNPGQLKPGLIVDFYSGTNFEMLLHRRLEPELRFNWSRQNPAWPDGLADMVSLRCRGYLKITEKASYAFQANCFDGARLFIDNVEVVTNWMSRMPEIGVAVLEPGMHTILLEQFKTAGPTGAVSITCKKSNESGTGRLDDSHFLHEPGSFKAFTRKPAPDFADRKSLPGAQEAESLTILESVPGSTVVLPFAARDKGFLLWGKAKVGDRLVLQFDSPEAGEKTLILALGRSRNAGIVKIAVNGVVVAEKADCFFGINHFLEYEYKRVALKKGVNDLEFTMIGSNPGAADQIKADGMPKFSIDYLRMR